MVFSDVSPGPVAVAAWPPGESRPISMEKESGNPVQTSESGKTSRSRCRRRHMAWVCSWEIRDSV